MFKTTNHSLEAIEIIEISGKLNTAEAYQAEEYVENALNKTASKLIVFIVSDLTYCSSYGLRIFMKAKKDMGKIGGQVVFLNPSPAFKELLELAGLENYFQIHEKWKTIINQYKINK